MSEQQGNLFIELAVIWGIVISTLIGTALYSWLQEVVNQACDEHCNIWPTHTGEMVQTGLNMGPCHARSLGWAKSYCKDLDEEMQTDHDLEVVGAASMAWSIIRSVVPSEITDHIMEHLKEEGLPSLVTHNIAEGQL
ncbi:hypothetical protein PAXINDRAFT_16020 [Paxillus involutus ATCC 200175]|uniref:Unplaced genomic scaffold PAXINscaffold_66, whole genome shotgun sequence n=1 Tax=Paxillus involutus ATCC 200175 TaxID=664439 RepID=A0A0C9TT81_PAXIN|nr:hypothetical protein PAXINDRAFT_16020 [Paxillus involutus ATCC 200175]